MTQLDPSLSTQEVFEVKAIARGHESDVRSLSSSTNDNGFLSASRDGTARQWSRNNKGEYKESKVWKDGHEGYINSVCSIPPNYIATSGSDTLIQIYDLSSSSSPTITSDDDESPIETLFGHSHNVCSLRHYSSNDGDSYLVSSSWDMTARIWKYYQSGEGNVRDDQAATGGTSHWECVSVLEDHGAAVWDSVMIDERLTLTACADSYIRLYEETKVKRIFKGHGGPVRALTLLSDKGVEEGKGFELFASASNDGTVRIWNYSTGDLISILQHDDFVYSLTYVPPLPSSTSLQSLPSTSPSKSSSTREEGEEEGIGYLVSSGEDGIVKVWNSETGQCQQTIEIPAISVWCVETLSNGDIACACSDHLVWIFSRVDTDSPGRTLSEEEGKEIEKVREEYQRKLEEKRYKKKGKPTSTTVSTDQSNRVNEDDLERIVVHDLSVLDISGTTEGEVKFVRSGGQDVSAEPSLGKEEEEGRNEEEDQAEGQDTFAYRWNGTKWENLGTVVVSPDDDSPTSPHVDESNNDKQTKAKMIHDGKEYDFVFQIDVKDDEDPIPLPYNLEDDPFEISTDFVNRHRLPESYIDRIVDFIRTSTSS